MENQEPDAITAFDTLYTSNQLQILKTILPYMQPKMQQIIAIYIKLSELIIAFRFSKDIESSLFSKSSKEFDLSCLLKELSPFMSESEKEMAGRFAGIQENMEQFKQMSEMMQMMNDMGGSPEAMLQNYLSEDQMAMFKMFQEDL